MGKRQADIAEADDAHAQGTGLDTGREFGIGLDGDTTGHWATPRGAVGAERTMQPPVHSDAVPKRNSAPVTESGDGA